MMLGEQQRLFTYLVAQLILWAYDAGYELTFGEAYRAPELAELYKQQGKGISNSLHTKRLAIDLNLFVKGVYQTDSAAYEPLGKKWKSLHPKCCWGGDFSRPDGNHFSMEFQGVR